MKLHIAYPQILIIIGILSFLPFTSYSQLPEGFSDEIVNDVWNFPVGITFSENGQCFIWEKDGLVFTTDENLNKITQPVIDLSEEVASYLDHGLIGFVLDPNFEENGFVYLMYIVDRHHLLYFGTADYDPSTTIIDEATIGRITRYTLDKSTDFTSIIPNSRHIVLGNDVSDGIPVIMASHGAGSLVFGTDGSLLASFGDQGSFTSPDPGSHPDTDYQQALDDGIISEKEDVGAFKSQLIDNLNGKILRIDPETGEGVPGNPFYEASNPGKAKSKVYTLGIRNGFRFINIPNSGDHDPASGKPGVLILGDVGSSFWEEINIIKEGGANLGWPIYEGHRKNWQFQNFHVENMDVINQVPDSCNQEFLFFDQLLFDELEVPFSFEHPCSPIDSLPLNQAFVHHRSAISYRNVKSGMDTIAEAPGFDEQGNPISISIADDNSQIIGEDFGGYTSMAGLIYTGENFPEEYQNQYFHYDLDGWIRNIKLDDNYNIEKVESFHTGADFILGMAMNPINGHIYYINVLNELHEIKFGGNRRPKAIISVDKNYGPAPLTISLSGENSFDLDGTIEQYYWDFGDGNSFEGIATDHIFNGNSTSESFEVKLVVTDDLGAQDSSIQIISINNSPPIANIISLKDGQLYPANRYNIYQLSAIATDAESSIKNLAYKWTIYLHHNTHYHPEPIQYNPIAWAYLQPIGCGDEDYWYRIHLEVKDEGGLIGTDEIEIFPYCEDDQVSFLNLKSTPSKEDVQLDFEVIKHEKITRYYIERSTEKDQFYSIGEIEDADLQNAYSFIDKYPILGNNYYRILAETDQGVLYHSNIIQAFFPYLDDIILYPNPSQGSITLFARNANGLLHFRLHDITGKQIYVDSWPTQNADFRKTINIPNLSSGVYIYTITHANGKASGVQIIH